MIRVTAKRDMRFTGYGLRFVAGVSHVIEKVPHGLRKSLERHEKAGHLVVDWDCAEVAPEAPVAAPGPVVVPSEPPEPEEGPAPQLSVFVADEPISSLTETSFTSELEPESVASPTPQQSTPPHQPRKRRRRR